jgi:3'(2'), 5'-bisphosphate nucleotidase
MVDRSEKEIAFAFDAIEKAIALCQRIQQDMRPFAVSKSDQSPVTVADFASQAVVARLLDKAFPEDPLVAEEDSMLLRDPGSEGLLAVVTEYVAAIFPEATPERVCQWIDRGAGEPGERFWTLDPVDGTKGFLRGDQYVVALALIEQGKVILGAMGCPNLDFQLLPAPGSGGVTLTGLRGQGAWVFAPGGNQSRRISVSSCKRSSWARILSSYESSHTDPEMLLSLKSKLGIREPLIRMDSQAKYAFLASGAGELIFRLPSPFRPEYDEHIWDHAAGSLIVEEAGGRVTDLGGHELDFGAGRELKSNTGVLASNGLLHEDALKAIRELGANRGREAS